MASNEATYQKYESTCGVSGKSDSDATTNLCVDGCVCCSILDKSVLGCEDSQKPCNRDQISACGNDTPSICDNVSDDSRKTHDEDQISACGKDTPSICGDVSDNSQKSQDKSEVSVCGKETYTPLICGKASDISHKSSSE